MNSSDKQRVREEVVKALGEACKSSMTHIATEALRELTEIKNQVFNQQTS